MKIHNKPRALGTIGTLLGLVLVGVALLPQAPENTIRPGDSEIHRLRVGDRMIVEAP